MGKTSNRATALAAAALFTCTSAVLTGMHPAGALGGLTLQPDDELTGAVACAPAPGLEDDIAKGTDSFQQFGSTVSAQTDWGDPAAPGFVTVGVDPHDEGEFRVEGTHAYGAPGTYTVVTKATSSFGGFDQITSTITVTDVALGAATGPAQADEAALTPVSGTEGFPVSPTAIAGFRDSACVTSAAAYAVKINWGDGTPLDTTSGAITNFGHSSAADHHVFFTVSGSHTYDEVGTYNIAVQVLRGVQTATASAVATIADAALHATGTGPLTSGTAPGGTAASIPCTALTIVLPPFTFAICSAPATPSSGALAQFTDDDPNGTLSDYGATIAWGDSQTSPGSISGTGPWTVSGSHSYARAGTYTVTVTIFEVGPATVPAASRASTTTTNTVVVGPTNTCIAVGLVTLTSFCTTVP